MVILFFNIMIRKLDEINECQCMQLELNSNSIEEKRDANWCTRYMFITFIIFDYSVEIIFQKTPFYSIHSRFLNEIHFGRMSRLLELKLVYPHVPNLILSSTLELAYNSSYGKGVA